VEKRTKHNNIENYMTEGLQKAIDIADEPLALVIPDWCMGGYNVC
jgi:hypothetical protein